MKWYHKPRYTQVTSSLHHYPDVSKVTGKPLDYLYHTPKSGFEYQKIYGDNTIELKGMPMGKTPEYMQERLRRFFSKFGRVVTCRCLPHPLDPYQCEGTAYISFRERKSCFDALKAPLKFPYSLHNKSVEMRLLCEDKKNDPQLVEKIKHWNSQLVKIAEQLFKEISSTGPKPLDKISLGIEEIPFNSKVPQSADTAVYRRFGDWKSFLSFPQCSELFYLCPDGLVHPRLVKDLRRHLILLDYSLGRKMQEEISINWRTGKPELPQFVMRQIRKWDHKDRLPFQLQILSRCHRHFRVFDERFLIRMARKTEQAKIKRAKRVERAKQLAIESKTRQEKKDAAMKQRIALPE